MRRPAGLRLRAAVAAMLLVSMPALARSNTLRCDPKRDPNCKPAEATDESGLGNINLPAGGNAARLTAVEAAEEEGAAAMARRC